MVDSPVSEAVVAVPGLWMSSGAAAGWPGPLEIWELPRNGDNGGSPARFPKPVLLVRGDEAGEFPHGEAAGSSTSLIVAL